jgi:hypothetical protein
MATSTVLPVSAMRAYMRLDDTNKSVTLCGLESATGLPPSVSAQHVPATVTLDLSHMGIVVDNAKSVSGIDLCPVVVFSKPVTKVIECTRAGKGEEWRMVGDVHRMTGKNYLIFSFGMHNLGDAVRTMYLVCRPAGRDGGEQWLSLQVSDKSPGQCFEECIAAGLGMATAPAGSSGGPVVAAQQATAAESEGAPVDGGAGTGGSMEVPAPEAGEIVDDGGAAATMPAEVVPVPVAIPVAATASAPAADVVADPACPCPDNHSAAAPSTATDAAQKAMALLAAGGSSSAFELRSNPAAATMLAVLSATAGPVVSKDKDRDVHGYNSGKRSQAMMTAGGAHGAGPEPKHVRM